MLLGQPVRQIAYFVPDIREAARRHSALFGSGPFFIIESLQLDNAIYRGGPGDVDHSAALAQWGEVMLELNQQNRPGPSYFHEVYPEGSGRYGLHHMAVILKDLEEGKTKCAEAGFETIFTAEAMSVPFAMADAKAVYGHLIEMYPDGPMVQWLYDTVRASAGKFTTETLFQQLPSPAW